jgi:hypothetical protein
MAAPAGAAASGLDDAALWGATASADLAEVADLTTAQIEARTRIQTNNARAIQSELRSLDQQVKESDARVKDNLEKIKLNKQLPYMVANVVEVRAPRPPPAAAPTRAPARARHARPHAHCPALTLVALPRAPVPAAPPASRSSRSRRTRTRTTASWTRTPRAWASRAS